MTMDSLRDFVRALEEAGELFRVRERVSTVKEITEVADRCMKSPGGGPALLFEHPVLPGGAVSRVPLAINLFGSHRRIALALGVASLEEIGARIAALLSTKVPDGLLAKLAMLPTLAEIAKYPPRIERAGWMIGERIARLVDGGYQKFWDSGERQVPALASQLQALHERFAGPEIKIFHRSGVHPLFYSSTVVGANMPNLTYLIPFDSLAAREQAWAAFGADPVWAKVRQESVEKYGQISNIIRISLYRATAYSPVR